MALKANRLHRVLIRSLPENDVISSIKSLLSDDTKQAISLKGDDATIVGDTGFCSKYSISLV